MKKLFSFVLSLVIVFYSGHLNRYEASDKNIYWRYRCIIDWVCGYVLV